MLMVEKSRWLVTGHTAVNSDERMLINSTEPSVGKVSIWVLGSESGFPSTGS